MEFAQGVIMTFLLGIVAAVMVRDYYGKKNFETKVEKYESFTEEELTAIEEVAATNESPVMESELDFLDMVKIPLSIDNLYDLCLSNYGAISREQKLKLRAVDGKEEMETASVVMEVLLDLDIICIKNEAVHLSVRYALTLYMDSKNKRAVRRKSTMIEPKGGR